MKKTLTIDEQQYAVDINRAADGTLELLRDDPPRRVELLSRHGEWLHFKLDGTVHRVRVTAGHEGQWEVSTGCERFVVRDQAREEFNPDSPGGGKGTVSDNVIRSPLPGKLLRLEAAAGDTVAAGDVVAVIESMKMENMVKAPRDGIVQSVHGEPGSMVDGGVQLVILAPAGESGVGE